MHGMTLPAMLITRQCLAYLEGNNVWPCTVKLNVVIISTHRGVGISTISHAEPSSAQTREMQCTQVVIPQVLAKGMVVLVMVVCRIIRLNIVKVAHDFQRQIKRFIADDLGLTNSYDTWHGTQCHANCLYAVCI